MLGQAWAANLKPWMWCVDLIVLYTSFEYIVTGEKLVGDSQLVAFYNKY